MPGHDSLPPEEQEELNELRSVIKRSLLLNLDKRVAGVFLTILLGGGGAAGWQFVTKAQLDERMSEERKARRDGDAEIKKEVVGLSAKVGSVQEVQQMDYSYREARRVVGEQIECRRNDNGCQERKVRELERIRRLNMQRLKAEKPQPPCADLACRN